MQGSRVELQSTEEYSVVLRPRSIRVEKAQCGSFIPRSPTPYRNVQHLQIRMLSMYSVGTCHGDSFRWLLRSTRVVRSRRTDTHTNLQIINVTRVHSVVLGIRS